MIKTTKFEPYTIEANTSIYDALVKIDLNNSHTLLVKEKDKIVGSLTDGDIRKALIKSRSAATPVRVIMNQDYVFACSELEVNKLFDDYKYITLIPIINDSRKLEAIYLRF